MTVHRPDERPSEPQENQCVLSHFSASSGAQEKTNCTSMLWSIDSYQIRVSADKYHLTVPLAQVSTHQSRAFFEVIWQITSFKWSQAQVYLFQWFISNMLCFCHYGPALLWFWFQTDLGRKISASFLKYRRGRPLLPWSRVGHALRPIFILCSLLKLVYFDSWSWQSFVSTSDVFNCLFPLDVQNEIQLLSRVFCYSWLVCLLGFWLRNASLVKIW